MQVEASSFKHCLDICAANDLFPEEIEVDSLVLADCLNGKFECPWNINYIVRKCKNIINHNAFISHTCREGNYLDDCLSKHGHDCENVCMMLSENDRSVRNFWFWTSMTI